MFGNTSLQEVVEAFYTTIRSGTIRWCVDFVFNSQLPGNLLKELIFELSAIIREYSQEPSEFCIDIVNMCLDNLCCPFCFEGHAEDVTCQNANNCQGIHVA